MLLAAEEYGKNLKLTVDVDAKVTAAYLETNPGWCSVFIICLSASFPFLNSQEPTDPEPSKTTTTSSMIGDRFEMTGI